MLPHPIGVGNIISSASSTSRWLTPTRPVRVPTVACTRGPKHPDGISPGHARDGARPADQAGQPMTSVFGHFRLHPPQLRHLMPRRIGVLAQQQCSTRPTTDWPNIHHPVHLLDRLEPSPLPRMPRLAPRLASRRLAHRPCWHGRRVRRRRSGRVARRLVEPLFPIRHPLLQRLDQGQPSHDQLPHRHRRGCPVFCRNAWRRFSIFTHTTL